jgi:hypothetical protein
MQTISEELATEEAAPLEADLRAKILESAPSEFNTFEAPKPAPVRRRKNRYVLEWGGMTALFLLAGFFTLSIMGQRVKHTFNSAANAITTGDDYSASRPTIESYTSSASAPSAGPVNSPSGGTVTNESSIDERSQLSSELRRLDKDSSSTLNGSGSGIYLDTVPQQRAVHKQGSLSVAVDDAEAKGSEVEILVKNVGGFVANNALSTGGDGRKTATLDVRVPVGSFESIVGKIGKLGAVREKSINGEDVTQRVTQAGVQRQSLAKELAIREAQLRALSSKKVAQRQAAIADVRQLRYQAAQARAQLEYLRKYAALSTLYVTLQDKQKVVAPASFSGSLSETGREAWASFVGAAKLPAQLFIWILAYSPLWIPALIVWRKWGRKLLSAG